MNRTTLKWTGAALLPATMLAFPSCSTTQGTSKGVKIGKKVDLAALHVGEEITVQMSEGLAISAVKPWSPET